MAAEAIILEVAARQINIIYSREFRILKRNKAQYRGQLTYDPQHKTIFSLMSRKMYGKVYD